jgi:hypothetical protein
VKLSKSQIHLSVQSIPELRFEDQRLSSFSGCVVVQRLFQQLKLRERLRECFAHREDRLIVGFPSIVLIMIVHLILGFRRLRDIERYGEDPVVLRTLGLILRHRVKKQSKEPVQLELFVPREEGYEFKVVVTNKRGTAKPILLFHNGRATQENLFSELKSQCNMDYVPTRRLSGNQLYFLSAVFAHNLYRELQMTSRRTDRQTTPKRAALWIFDETASLRHRIIQRAGRLTRPRGRLRLTLSGNEVTRKEMMHYLNRLAGAA